MGQSNCGQAVVELLENYGIDTAFGIPGVHTIEFYRGLGDRSINHILTRHEQGAGFMADGYARVTGKAAACFLISGPGLTNAATPIAQAYSDSQPMVVVATTNTRREIGKGWGPFHELRNQRLIAEQFCSYAGQALSAEDIPEIIAQAFAAMESGRPRPVYIEIPRDILSDPAVGDWTPRRVGGRPGPREGLIAEAAELLSKSERPLILTGAGANEASAAVTELVEILDAAVISSFCGKGVVAESHPNVLGAALSMPEARKFVEMADVCVAIGTELSTVDASNQTLSFDGKLIRIDIDPKKISDRYPADIAIVADADLSARALVSCLKQQDVVGAAASWKQQLDKMKAKLDAFGSPKSREHRKILDCLRDTLPDDGIVVGDMTQLAYSGNHFYQTEQPRTWLHPASFATLGYALPTAIGAKVAAPDKPVVSLAGDCGFLFTCQEMATAADRRVPIVQILWNNEALGEIRDAMIGSQIAPVEVNGLNPDYLSLARSFHWHAEAATSLDQLAVQIEAGLTAEMPTLIEVREGGGDWAT